ncbi:MAG: hypothetical protein OFPI_14160 [Osedax symbiont Rs2]|nr:MAG: hypothetical protein OFPI_14160 [Osedax symbiont Rs2]
MKISYKVLTGEHSEQYRALRLQSLKLYPEAFCAVYAEQVQLEKLYFQQLMEDDVQEHFMFGAFDDQQLVGLCGLITNTQRLLKAAEIIQMYINKDYRRLGIGLALISQVLDTVKARKLTDIVLLEVLKDNSSAYEAYLKAGFRVNEKLSDPEISWIMEIKV